MCHNCRAHTPQLENLHCDKRSPMTQWGSHTTAKTRHSQMNILKILKKKMRLGFSSAEIWGQLRKRRNSSSRGIRHSWRKGRVGAGRPPCGTTHPWAGGCPVSQTLWETWGAKAYLRGERGEVWLWGLVWEPREEFMTLSTNPKLQTWFLPLEAGFSINKGIFLETSSSLMEASLRCLGTI